MLLLFVLVVVSIFYVDVDDRREFVIIKGRASHKQWFSRSSVAYAMNNAIKAKENRIAEGLWPCSQPYSKQPRLVPSSHLCSALLSSLPVVTVESLSG